MECFWHDSATIWKRSICVHQIFLWVAHNTVVHGYSISPPQGLTFSTSIFDPSVSPYFPVLGIIDFSSLLHIGLKITFLKLYYSVLYSIPLPPLRTDVSDLHFNPTFSLYFPVLGLLSFGFFYRLALTYYLLKIYYSILYILHTGLTF